MAKMIQRILQQKNAIHIVFNADWKAAHLIPTWQDVEVLQSIDNALSPLSSLTDVLSGEKSVMVSAIVPMLQLNQSSLLKEEETDT